MFFFDLFRYRFLILTEGSVIFYTIQIEKIKVVWLKVDLHNFDKIPFNDFFYYCGHGKQSCCVFCVYPKIQIDWLFDL
jgi:hypothetical protein